MNDKFVTCLSCGGVGAAIISMFGGWDVPIQTLIVFMAIDFITGIACAMFFGKSDKSENGALNSKSCWRGIIKKMCTILIIVCAHYADILLNSDYIRNAVIIAFCASELISICENAALMGVLPEPVQKIFAKIIDVMKGK